MHVSNNINDLLYYPFTLGNPKITGTVPFALCERGCDYFALTSGTQIIGCK